MHRYQQVAILIASAVVASSCTGNESREALTQPGFVSQSSAIVASTSSIAFARPASNVFCPSIAPFYVAFGVTVSANGPSQIAIDGVRFQFIDSFGIQAPMITLPMPTLTIAAPNPTRQVGSAIVPAGSAITLPLRLGIGCGTGSQGTIVVIVDTTDHLGRHASQRVNVTVR